MIKRFFRDFGIQSKLVALVLATTLASMLLTGLLGFWVSSSSMEQAGYQQLTSFRNARAEAIREYIEQLGDNVMVTSEIQFAIDGLRAFTQAYGQLPDTSDNQKKKLETYYKSSYTPSLAKYLDTAVSAATYYPSTNADRYLKYHYAATPSETYNKSRKDLKDGSTWGDVHREYHARFARLAKLFGYDDILLVDAKSGNVVYSVAKEDDFATNLLSGPYRSSQVAKLFLDARNSPDPAFLSFTDFEHYAPSLGKPNMFAGTNIFDGDELIGVLIFQLNNDRIDNLMTSSKKWKEVGLGSSGETYLVGGDKTFRSTARFFLDDSSKFLDSAKKYGVPQGQIDEIRRTGSPVLVQTVNTQGATRALEGAAGTAKYRDYRGVPVVASYQPIRFGSFNWALIAEIDQSELFSGIGQLSRYQLLLAAILIPAITYFSILASQAFIRPIRRLLQATRQISSGDYRFEIPISARDEFGDLAGGLNTMSEKLGELEDLLRWQIDENDRLLRSILPSGAASRIKQGVERIADNHASVSVLYADIEGWHDLSQAMEFDASMQLLKELTRSLDEISETFDLEHIQDAGASYMAIAGLSHPRIDHQKRSLDCAFAMLKLIRRFNRHHGVDLSLDIGLHSGAMAASVVSSDRLSFDLWGQTISIARGIRESPKRNVIQVTEPIQQALQGLYRFLPLPAVAVKGYGQVAIWEVEALLQSPDPGECDSLSIQELSSR
jgi:class 3 adenylate cyclase